MARQRFPELQPDPIAPRLTTGLMNGSRRPLAVIFLDSVFLTSAGLLSFTATVVAAGLTATAGVWPALTATGFAAITACAAVPATAPRATATGLLAATGFAAVITAGFTAVVEFDLLTATATGLAVEFVLLTATATGLAVELVLLTATATGLAVELVAASALVACTVTGLVVTGWTATTVGFATDTLFCVVPLVLTAGEGFTLVLEFCP